jgi:hypothetical protein
VTTAIASKPTWAPVGPANAGSASAASLRADAPHATRTHLLHRVMGFGEDAVLVLLTVLLFPLIILLVGTPIALVLQALIEVARRSF